MILFDRKKWLRIGGISAGILVIIAGLVMGFERAYAEKVYPGVHIGDHDVSGMPAEALLNFLEEYQTALTENGVEFRYQDATLALKPGVYGGEADITYSELYTLDVNKTADVVYRIGRSGSFWGRARDQLAAFVGRRNPSASVYFQPQEISAAVHRSFGEYEIPATDAEFFVEQDDSFRAAEHRDGEVFNDATISRAFHGTLSKLSDPVILLQLEEDRAQIRTEDVEALIPDAERIADSAPVQLTFSDKSWTVDHATLARWLWVEGAVTSVTSESESEVLSATSSIQFNNERVEDFFNGFAGEIEKEAKNGKFEIRDGTVVEIQVAQTGIEINTAETIEQLENTLLGETGSATIPIAYEETPPEVTADTIDDFGVVELLGTGHTDFRGSGPNRIHNVKLGASMLHGILVAPGEEFSTLEVMNGFRPEDGWKEGYVIKGDRTVPEYGGGACQFGTTLFRAAMGAGMPVTERTPHAYIVSYYYDENRDPGKDATIYDPGRDFQFINDTDHYILLQSRIENFDFYIDFWGTNDGRVIEQSRVRTSNWLPAPPAQRIETEELAPGETDCIEHARPGVNTAFDYNLTYPDGRVDATTFTSKYKPWPEVCLVGKQPAPLTPTP